MSAAFGVAAAVALVPMLLVTLWTFRGWSRPSVVLVAEGFQMWVLAPSWVILVGALVSHRWWLVIPAAAVAGPHLVWCGRATRRTPTPTWVDGAPTFTLFVANVLYVNEDHDAVAACVMAHDADVVVLNETTPALFAALERRGVAARYPLRLSTPGGPFGEAVMAREPHPAGLGAAGAAGDAGAPGGPGGPSPQGGLEVIGGQWVPWAAIGVGDRTVRAFAVHAKAPKDAPARAGWRRHLQELGATALAVAADRSAGSAGSAGSAADPPAGASPVCVLAGDFNAAPWHGPFRRLLAGGFRSAHQLLGRGLSRSWTAGSPWLHWMGPLMRLDHVLVTDGAYPVSLVDVDVPGSDHRGVFATMAVAQRRPMAASRDQTLPRGRTSTI